MLVSDVAALRSMCVCVMRRSAARGLLMRGRLRRPDRPLQVIGVLAAVLPIAAISLPFTFATDRTLQRSNALSIADLGGRLNASTIALHIPAARRLTAGLRTMAQAAKAAA
jgi:hypothetical protein